MHNRHGRDPLRPRRLASRSQILNVNAGTGEGNYLLTIPLLELPGRNLDLSLNLYYNSNMWTALQRTPTDKVYIFDRDGGWPAPGWSLGFGRLVWTGYYPVLQDADGTLHPWVMTESGRSTYAHTADGTLIDYLADLDAGTAQARYPNGTIVFYGAKSDPAEFSPYLSMVYPTEIVDVHGNFIKIEYVRNSGPAIQSITDTLGRTINFCYDTNSLLTAITAPGLRGTTRPVVQFHYSPLNLPPSGIFIWDSPAQGVDAIYFPGTSTGYWFGDTDSYTTDSGIITKVSRRRGMTAEPGSLNEQVTVTRGLMTRERLYNYDPHQLLSVYTTMTESWEAMDTPPAVTTFAVTSGNTVFVDTIYPDQTKVSQWTYNRPGSWSDGLVFRTQTYDHAGVLLRQTDTTWARGDYDSPRITATTLTDQITEANPKGQAKSTTYGYNSPTKTNQLTDVAQTDYHEPDNQGQPAVLRSTHTDYVLDPGYADRHIFNLPQRVSVSDQAGIVSLTEYTYDHPELAAVPGVPGHSAAFDPSSPSYDSATAYRGNLTEITRYADARIPSNMIVEFRQYDITGNLVAVSGTGCQHTAISYDQSTQYAYPSAVTCGSADPASPVRLTRSFAYDLSTGLLIAGTDPNGRTTQYTYDPGSLRVQRVTLPTGAFLEYSYDDEGMSSGQAAYSPSRAVAAETVTRFNGLGLVYEVDAITDNESPNVVAMQYDALGRLWKRSLPYTGGQAMWTTFSRDALGRIISVQVADGARWTWHYDEPQRPSSASAAPGQTVRIQSPDIFFLAKRIRGADRWYRADALGQLVEVVEPNAYESPPGGSVFGPGNVKTSYSYDGLGLLQAVQGAGGQERRFRYDSLGRLIAQYLPEKSPTLDNTGAYTGSGGLWSDAFTYDKRSNLTSHTDARGVKTIYDYAGDPLDPIDPLNRLYRVSYEFTGPAGPPIQATAPADYTYMRSGDVTRPYQITTSPIGSEQAVQQYAYDAEGRLASTQLTWPTAGPAPLVLQLDYQYDSLSRLTGKIYPAQSGVAKRKRISYSYGLNGKIAGLQIDGTGYASQLSYNQANQATSITTGPTTASPPTVENYAYDPVTGLLASQQVKRENTVLLDLAYSYFPNGQVDTLSEGGGKRKFSYIYDSLDRLWKFIKVSGADGPEWSEEYTFDEHGNRTAVKASGSLNGAPAPSDGLPVLTYSATTNRITTAGFSYDAAGNQTRAQRADGSWVRCQYDQAGHLAEVTDDNGHTLESSGYGAGGRRLVSRRGTESTYYFWDGVQVITEYTQLLPAVSPEWSKSLVYLGSRLLSTFQPGLLEEFVHCHHPDRLGTRLITSNIDNSAIEQVALPFGTLIPGEPKHPANPIFTSYDRGMVTGIDYATNRYYHLGRFTQVDPAGMGAADLANPQSLNLYSYARNDPVNLVDPTGLDPVMVCDSGSFTDDHTFTQDCWMYYPDEDPFPGGPANDPIGGVSGPVGVDTGQRQFPNLVLSSIGFSGPSIPNTVARPTTALDRLFLVWGGVELAPLLGYTGLISGSGAVLAVNGADTAVGVSTSNSLGAAGEAIISDLPGYQTEIQSITGTADYRILDALEEFGVVEVKNVARQALTRQLTDSILVAQSLDVPFYLVTRLGTQLTGPLVELIEQGVVNWIPVL